MDIHYQFVASGHGDVVNAYESIDKAAARSKKVAEDAGKNIGAVRSAKGGGMRAKLDASLGDEVRAVERAEAKKRAVIERSQRQIADGRRRYERDQDRRDQVATRERERIEAKAQAKKDQSRQQSIQTLKDIGGGAVLGATGAIAGIIGSAAKESLSLQEQANRISVNARKHGQDFMDPTALRKSFERTAIDTPGTKSADVADAIQRFISLTGDTDTAMKGQGVFAKVASATGGNVGDVAEAAASLSQQFDITGLEDMKEVLAALTFQGKEGAFELKDAASQFQALAAAGASFGIAKGVQGVKTLGGLTQIARTGTKSASQAATSVQDVLAAFKSKGKDLRAAGVDVYDKEGKARDVRDLITESIAKVGGTNVARKQEGLTKIFGEQGIRAINPLIAKYNETFRGTQGSDADKTAAAMQRLRDEFSKSIDAAGNWDDVLDDSAQAQQTASAQLDAAWERIKASVGDKALPAIANLIDKFAGQDGAEGALEPFIEATGLAAEALGGLVDALGFKKQRSHAEEAKAAEKELHRFDLSHQTATYSKEDLEKRKALVNKIATEKEAMFTKPGEGGPMSLDDFVKKYQEAGGAGATKTAAETVGKAVQSDDSSVFKNDFFQKNFAGENQAQADLRHQFAGDVQAQKMGMFDTKDAQTSVDALAKATQDAAAKIAAANAAQQQGTIFAGQ